MSLGAAWRRGRTLCSPGCPLEASCSLEEVCAQSCPSPPLPHTTYITMSET